VKLSNPRLSLYLMGQTAMENGRVVSASRGGSVAEDTRDRIGDDRSSLSTAVFQTNKSERIAIRTPRTTPSMSLNHFISRMHADCIIYDTVNEFGVARALIGILPGVPRFYFPGSVPFALGKKHASTRSVRVPPLEYALMRSRDAQSASHVMDTVSRHLSY